MATQEQVQQVERLYQTYIQQRQAAYGIRDLLARYGKDDSKAYQDAVARQEQSYQVWLQALRGLNGN